MRVSEDRYSREQRQMAIALRFLQHEARTHTVRQWTGLTDDRIRKLYRAYLSWPAAQHTAPAARHRGKSPQQWAFFLRTVRLRHEAAVLASLYRLVGALPDEPGRDAARLLPDIGRGELLCQAYEVYRQLSAAPAISFEHAVFLLTALARDEELSLRPCRGCGALVVVDGLRLRPPRCLQCAAGDAFTLNC